MLDRYRPRRRSRLVISAVVVGIAVLWLVIEPWRGPHLFHAFGNHGVDVGDFAPFVLASLGAAAWWRG
jgi:hypothetical protein